MDKCKFCGDTRAEKKNLGGTSTIRVRCPLCGIYDITDTADAIDINGETSSEDRILFSGYIRNNSTEKHLIKLGSDTLKKIKDIVSPYKKLTVDEKIDLIIRYVAESTKNIGNPVDMHNTYSRFYVKNEGELFTLVDWLEKMDLGKRHGGGFILSAKGWQRYEKTKEINERSKKVFVAMNFDSRLDYIFTDGIAPACTECGFSAVRVDLVEHNEKICDRIIAEIKGSRFIVADFTGQKHGVYFESGYAYGLGLPVIWMSQKGEELHFDTRQYNHIFWESVSDLKEKLINRIKATIK